MQHQKFKLLFDDTRFLGIQTLNVEKMGVESSINIVEELKIKEKELETVIELLEEA